MKDPLYINRLLAIAAILLNKRIEYDIGNVTIIDCRLSPGIARNRRKT